MPSSEPLPPDPASLARARDLVAAVLPDDVAAAGPDEDLRDYGLDSLRVMDVLARVVDAGGDIAYADLIGGPTLTIIAAALPSTAPNEGQP